MIRLRLLLFLLTVALIVAAGLIIFSRRETGPEFQKGIVYGSWRSGEYSSAESDETLANVIKPTGVNWISLVVTCYQNAATSVEIHCRTDANTPRDEDVVHAIQYAHSLGLKVMLKPHIDLESDDSHWRGEIGFGSDEAAWAAWFKNYTDFIVHYAALAQENGADYFVAGTELAGTSHRANDWRAVIAAVRRVYGGPITYAANRNGEEFDLLWWDAVDAIGVDAYYRLTESSDPTPEELKAAWLPIVGRLEQLSKRWDRKIILTEIGYQSRDGANRTPWRVANKTLDLQEQADCYQAVFDAFTGREWWQGVFWWVWDVHPDQGGPTDDDFTAANKPAEDVLRLNYGAPPRPAPTVAVLSP